MVCDTMSDPRPVMLRGGWVISLDPKIDDIARADILIVAGRISSIAPAIDTPDAEVIDADGMIVILGLVDTHRHAWQSCVRHRYADMEAGRYFAEMLGARGAAYRSEDARIGNLLGAVSALEAGTTTMLDWSHVQNSPVRTGAAVSGLKDAGIRGVVGYGWPLIDGQSWIAESQRVHPADIGRVRARYFASDDQLLTLAMAGRGPEMTVREVWQKDLQIARDLGIRSIIHVGAYPHNARHNAVTQMYKADALGDDITFVHCCCCDDDEIAMIADSGAMVSLGVHTEMVSQRIGDIPLDRLLAADVRPSLNGDTETKCCGDTFTQMRHLLAYYGSWIGSGHSRAKDAPAFLLTRDVLEFATIRGATALGLGHKIGTLSPGKQADIIMIRATDLNIMPVSDPVGAVVLGAHPGNVDSVFVAGGPVKRGGKMIRNDLDRIRADAVASQDYVLEAHV